MHPSWKPALLARPSKNCKNLEKQTGSANKKAQGLRSKHETCRLWLRLVDACGASWHELPTGSLSAWVLVASGASDNAFLVVAVDWRSLHVRDQHEAMKLLISFLLFCLLHSPLPYAAKTTGAACIRRGAYLRFTSVCPAPEPVAVPGCLDFLIQSACCNELQ